MLQTRQDKINELSLFLLDYSDNIQVTHDFIENYYIRTMHVPRDTVLVGFKHLKKHLNVLSKGKCILYSNLRTLYLQDYAIFSSPALEQKSFYFIEDSKFSTIHNTKQTDIRTIEKEFVMRSIPALNSKKVYKL